MQAVSASSKFGWVVRHAVLVAVVVGCSDRIARTEDGSADTTSVETVGTSPSTTPLVTVATAPITVLPTTVVLTTTLTTAPDLRIELYECFTTHGIADSDPAVPPGPPLPVGRYPLDIATAAWDACKDTYVSALRQVLNDFQGVVAEFPADADAFGFADCMAELGWITTFRGGQATDLAAYISDNTECRLPRDGSSSAASYCRLVNALFDMAKHDPTMSITGIPALGDDNSRLAAAVHLYDELAEAAPPELVDDLRTVQDGFRQNGSQFPEAAWTRAYEYHASVCGAPVHLGSLD